MLVAASVALALLGLAVVAILPARAPSPALSQLLVMHNTLVASRSRVGQAIEGPHDQSPSLEQEVSGVLEGRLVESWVYQLDREVLTVHRLEDNSLIPKSASHLPIRDRRVSFFELEDLTALAWRPEAGKLIVVLGAGSLPTQLRLANWLDANPPVIQAPQ